MSAKNGGPVFPIVLSDETQSKYCDGMTLRDYFAAKAMQGIVMVLHQGIRPADIPAMCADAYCIADAMLAESEKGGE